MRQVLSSVIFYKKKKKSLNCIKRHVGKITSLMLNWFQNLLNVQKKELHYRHLQYVIAKSNKVKNKYDLETSILAQVMSSID